VAEQKRPTAEHKFGRLARCYTKLTSSLSSASLASKRYSFALPLPMQNNRALQMNTA
jgi:hypothetical protein